MIVHQSHAGALIGRAGTKIKELREATRANIKVIIEYLSKTNLIIEGVLSLRPQLD